jgi:hypothetical protein
MKNLSISLSLIALLVGSQIAVAELAATPSNIRSNIETITVTATPEVANFEIYSEKHSVRVMHKMMDVVVASLDVSRPVKTGNTTEI